MIMTQEEKNILLKDLSARLPYGTRIHISHPSDNAELDDWLTTGTIDNFSFFGSVKPYLRPMSSMTEEEQQEYYDLTHQEEDDVWAKCLFDKMVDFCNERHLDYRGLIEKGLALEAPEGVY